MTDQDSVCKIYSMGDPRKRLQVLTQGRIYKGIVELDEDKINRKFFNK